jgi:plasmid stabilization system protein ParE
MNYRVVIHDTAKDDIRRNALWWADKHTRDQAATWFYHAFDSIEKLSSLPESHPLARENDDFPYEIREPHFGLGSRPRYRAVFVIRDATVHVLAVRRAAQDTILPTDLSADLW